MGVVGAVNANRLFNLFKDQVGMNRPAILNVAGLGGWATDKFSGHSMPVIGTKREAFTWTCLKINKHWLYVHTTWRGGWQDLGNKRWYRFDKHVYPLSVWDAITINVG